MRTISKWLAVGTLALSMAGCANDPATLTDVHTGITAGTSQRYQVYSGLLVSVFGQAFVATKQGVTKQGIYINQISTGTGWTFFTAAYSFGTQLPYVKGGSEVLGCDGGCTLQETGIVVLTKEQFNTAAQNGIELELVGERGNVVIKVPAEAFQQALAYRG